MSTSCYGDTVYCDGTVFENPADSNKTATAAYWKNQNKTQYGPIMGITSIGNVVGTCIAPGETATGLFTAFVTGDNLASARTYSKKDDQTLFDDIAKAVGLSRNDVEKILKDNAIESEWDITKSTAPEETKPLTPPTGVPGTGQEMTIVYVAVAMMIASAGVIFFARKKRVTE